MQRYETPENHQREGYKGPEITGFEVVGIRGSHHYLHHAKRGTIVTVPVHSGKTLAPKTLQTILSQAGISQDEFRELL